MYAYSRINEVSTKRSKSLDLRSLPPHIPPTSLANHTEYSEPKDTKPSPHIITRSNTTTRLDPARIMLGQDVSDEAGEVFGVILGRYSCTSIGHHGKVLQSRSSFHSVVKRSFSMRRSASVADGYRRMCQCRCHELSGGAAEVDDHPHNSAKKDDAKKRGKLFKVCRSLFGLM